MPRRTLLSVIEREQLLAIPSAEEELIRHFTLGATDRALIAQRRGAANRLGIAVQLCLLRFPGQGLLPDAPVPESMVRWLAQQLRVVPAAWKDYAGRAVTRREHQSELRAYLGVSAFGQTPFRQTLRRVVDVALQTDKGIVLANHAIEVLRQARVQLPTIDVIERLCGEALTVADRRIHTALTESLTAGHRRRLDGLLKRRADSAFTWLAWLRKSPTKPNSRHLVEHLRRLTTWQDLNLPAGLEHRVHRNRLLKMAREGAQMTSADLARFETQRRHATLVAIALEGRATVIDDLVELNERILARLFNAAKHRHQQQFQNAGRAINDKVRLFGRIGQALLEARASGGDPFGAIEAIIGWTDFADSVTEAQQLAQPADFDFLHRLTDHQATLRRYAPHLLAALRFKAAPVADELLAAIEVLRSVAASDPLPRDVPTGFVRRRWRPLVITDDGIDRRYYEWCVLAEIKNALRSGDLWVEGSRQFKDFGDYLLPLDAVDALRQMARLPVAARPDAERYLADRLATLDEQLVTVNRLARTDDLPDALLTSTGLKLSPLEAIVPEAAQGLIRTTAAMLPSVKITDLLLEVDKWTGFSRHFAHLKDGAPAKDTSILLTALLADAINLGLAKMAEACPGMTYAKLAWVQAWHVRDETYAAALAELVNAQFRQPFAAHWGDGTTSSSDGQRFRSGSAAQSTGHVNPKYGSEPGRLFYTHISDQYAPFHTTVVNVGLRDSTFVLDGLLYHESDLRIAEHYTDTAGFTDHVFGLMHLLGFRFAPRIRDLADTRLFVPRATTSLGALKPLIGGTLNTEAIRAHWPDIQRLVGSIQQGTVTASLMLRKLGSYPRQNGLAVALREVGRIERSLFILDWLQDVELRRRVHAGLNKGEARNALARAVFLHRLGEIRDRSFEQQRHRASGLNLVTAAIVLWNTVYLERTVAALTAAGRPPDRSLLPFLSPLGWEHIHLTGDYLWRRRSRPPPGKFRPLRDAPA
jgi:TnpA family transposase